MFFLVPNKPAVQRVTWALCHEIKRPCGEADHSLLSSTEVMDLYSNTATPPTCFCAEALHMGKLLNFAFQSFRFFYMSVKYRHVTILPNLTHFSISILYSLDRKRKATDRI